MILSNIKYLKSLGKKVSLFLKSRDFEQLQSITTCICMQSDLCLLVTFPLSKIVVLGHFYTFLVLSLYHLNILKQFSSHWIVIGLHMCHL